jgi:hypothetical protein
MAKITWKIWILIIFISFALLSIFSFPPQFLQKGVIVSFVEPNSFLFEQGLRQEMSIKQINNNPINTIEDINKYLGEYSNLIENQTKKIDILTDSVQIIGLVSNDIVNQFSVKEIPPTRIKTGLDIQGGARALVTAQDTKLTNEQLDDLIAISQQRLNIYGLTDLQISKVSDLSGDRFMLVEIAGSSPGDLENLIAQQGKFEAKIGNDTVFVGGNEDITYVGRSGNDAGIYNCYTTQEGDAC